MTTVRELVTSARARLATAGVDANEAAMDAALLARHLLGWDLARLVAHETDPCPAGLPTVYDTLVARRASREPMSLILGRREFRGLEFEVTPDVLAPRPETEIIIEAALELSGAGVPPARSGGAGVPPANIIDVGTGTGCLAVCLAREFPSARVIATDISPAALAVAARNAVRHAVSERVSFVRTSLLAGLTGPAGLIVSNPPYVPAADIPLLPPEVRDWEPRGALDGGADGLDMVRALLADAPRVLAPGGWLIMEFGFGQEDGIREAVSRSALDLASIRTDLQGIPRTLVATAARSR
jgi:release factor glutamine methyltransferase